SFTYNIVQELGELGAEIQVVRNDQMTLDEIKALNPDRIVISPGPGFPKDAGISREVIRELGQTIPVLGVCLGHQCIGEVYGGVVSHAPELMHGKTSHVCHYGDPLFANVPDPFVATRYHSLIVQEDTLPESLEVNARAQTGEIMGLRHKELPVIGVQFHPESILTAEGMTMLQNFLEMDFALVQG
ncbi:MAG: aminodeoxychorismate/anthranilate synthase component II, partial [Anaerolineae bacterium]|nr:aminodeoxychorismate/anthranilate synthase component II [Anaerolineae bacterium]